MKWDIVNKNGESFCDYADDGSIFYGYDTRAEAEYQLKCMHEIDAKYCVENEWRIIEV